MTPWGCKGAKWGPMKCSTHCRAGLELANGIMVWYGSLHSHNEPRHASGGVSERRLAKQSAPGGACEKGGAGCASSMLLQGPLLCCNGQQRS